MTRLLAAAAAILLACPAHAGPEPGDGLPIRTEDLARLDALDESAGVALRQALGGGDAAQVASVAEALAGTPQAAAGLDPSALAGDWTCRMTKIGGLLPVVAYPPFRCQISADGGILQFEKLTGSQRTRGTIHSDRDRLVYLGSTFVAGEQPKRYDEFPEEVRTDDTETLPDVALVEPLGPDRLRMLFPRPYRESVLNVMVLTR